MATKEQTKTAHERIVVDPNIMAGKPTIRGTRIPVELVLEQLSYNLDLNELFAAYPGLTKENVQAALAFAGQAVKARKFRALPKSESPDIHTTPA